MATTLALVERVRDLLIEDGSRETFTDAQVIRTALNPIAREIAALALSESETETITTAAGTRDYSLPAAIVPFVRIASITFGDDRRPMAWIDRSQMAQSTSVGEPAVYSIWNNRIYFDPAPNAVFTVYIDAWHGGDVAVASNPAASTDEFQFTADVEDCLVWGSASMLSAINSEREKEARFSERYGNKISQLRQKLQPDSGVPASITDEFDEDAYFLAY